MKLFECNIDLNGTWRTVRVQADSDRDAYALLCAQYGAEAVAGYPHEVRKGFWD